MFEYTSDQCGTKKVGERKRGIQSLRKVSIFLYEYGKAFKQLTDILAN
jgi:hypothetical protein